MLIGERLVKTRTVAGKWRARQDHGRKRSLLGPLAIAKEEQLVPLDGTAERPAILVTLQRVARGSEEVASVEVTVADEFENLVQSDPSKMKVVFRVLREAVRIFL